MEDEAERDEAESEPSALPALAKSVAINDIEVTVVDLAGRQLTARQLVPLANALLKNGVVTSLNISDNFLGQASSKILGPIISMNASLQTVKARNVGLSADGCEELAEALGKSLSLEHLDVSHNEIGDEGLPLMAAGLALNTSLQSLDVSACSITSSGAAAFAAALAAASRPQTLHLSIGLNDLDATCLVSLAALFACTSPALCGLDLRCIASVSAALPLSEFCGPLASAGPPVQLGLAATSMTCAEIAIAPSTPAHYTFAGLDSLDLSQNSLNVSSALASLIVPSLPCLRVLSLNQTFLRDTGVQQLCRALLCAPRLERLALDDNMFASAGAAALVDLLSSAPSLTALSISGNASSGCEALLSGVALHRLLLRDLTATRAVEDTPSSRIAAAAIAALRLNTSLRRLSIDAHHASLDRLLAAHAAVAAALEHTHGVLLRGCDVALAVSSTYIAGVQALLRGRAAEHNNGSLVGIVEAVRDQEGRPMTHVAVHASAREELDWLVRERCVAVDARDAWDKATALHLAAALPRAHLIPLLVGLGASVVAEDVAGRTPLMLAAGHGHDDAVLALLEAGSDARYASSVDCNTPLHCAAAADCFNAAALLVQRGADSAALNAAGRTALDLCAPHSTHDWRALLHPGSDTAAPDGELKQSLPGAAMSVKSLINKIGKYESEVVGLQSSLSELRAQLDATEHTRLILEQKLDTCERKRQQESADWAARLSALEAVLQSRTVPTPPPQHITAVHDAQHVHNTNTRTRDHLHPTAKASRVCLLS